MMGLGSTAITVQSSGYQRFRVKDLKVKALGLVALGLGVNNVRVQGSGFRVEEVVDQFGVPESTPLSQDTYVYTKYLREDSKTYK